MCIHPLEKLDDRRLVGCKVKEGMPDDRSEHIEVVGQPPITSIMSCLSGEIRRIDKENHTRNIFVLYEQFAIVCLDNLQPVEVSAAIVRTQLRVIVKRLLFDFVDIRRIFPREQN